MLFTLSNQLNGTSLQGCEYEIFVETAVEELPENNSNSTIQEDGFKVLEEKSVISVSVRLIYIIIRCVLLL